MKRDLDLYRAILLYLEDTLDPSEPGANVDTNGILVYGNTDSEQPERLRDATPSEIVYHCTRMEEAGLLVASFSRDYNGTIRRVMIKAITHEGHDFIDNVRNDTVWNKTKEYVKEKGGSAGLKITVAVAKEKMMSLLDLGLP